MSEFVVHSIPGSPYGRAVFATLEEKGAPYRLALVDGAKRKDEPHISRHPFGRVPVLEHNGFWLYETQAIVRYLDRVLPAPALTPTDPRAAGRMDQVMNICDWYLFQGVNNVIGFQRIIRPRLMNEAPEEEIIARAMPQARTVFSELSRLLDRRQYFVGDAISLADIMVAPQLDFLRATPEWKELATPNLSTWLARMTARPSFRRTTWERIAALAKSA
ncbi:MAG TPA: glutathione S-transferase family protein [Xanthobacteraceae bacterium]|nr:glutathione S-transferase family protein [Xanthobacteraceae bacterium]